ncbi:MAG: hypothetical protein GX801_09015 [Fibrobacter sp.]|nr:hypothetical protein [Fibrobacter sp.]
MLYRLSFVLLAWTIFTPLLWANEVWVKNLKGRADYYVLPSQELISIKIDDKIPSNGVVHLSPATVLTLEVAQKANMVLYGAGRFRVHNLLSESGGQSTTLFTEINARMEFFAQYPDLLRFNCLQTTVRKILGQGKVQCNQENQQVQIYVERGGVEIEREGAHTIALEPGIIWRGKLSSQGYEEFQQKAKLFQDQELQKAEVQLLWESTEVESPSSNWRLDEFFKQVLLKNQVLQENNDSLNWLLKVKLSQFDLKASGSSGVLNVALRLDLQNKKFPIQNKVLRFQQNFKLALKGDTTMGFLQLLPLKSSNQKIMASGFAEVVKAVEDYIATEIADPFRRSGFSLDEKEVIERLDL